MLPAVVLSAEWYFADTAAKTSPWSALARMVVVLVFAHEVDSRPNPLHSSPKRPLRMGQFHRKARRPRRLLAELPAPGLASLF